MGMEESEVGMKEWYWRGLERESEERERKNIMRTGFELGAIARERRGSKECFGKRKGSGGYK